MSTEEAIREYAKIKGYIKEAEAKLEQLAPQIVQAAEFKFGSKTGHATGGGFKVTVTKRENEKWNQDELAKVRDWNPEKFNTYFRAKYEPQSAKHTQAMMTDEQFRLVVEKCRTVTEGKPGITLEPIEQDATR